MQRNSTNPSRRRTWAVAILLSAASLAGCGNNVTAPAEETPPPPAENPQPSPAAFSTVGGTVVTVPGRLPIAGATVRLGTILATTDGNGRYEFREVATGSTTLNVEAVGFETHARNVTVRGPTSSFDIILPHLELIEAGDFSLYVPRNVTAVRGILVALGGPDTRAFTSEDIVFGAPVAEVEASLQTLGLEFRRMASDFGLAILGTSRAAMPDAPESDAVVLDAIAELAVLSARADLAAAPLLVYGMSGGAPQGSGFVARHPDRALALFLKVPAAIASISGAALEVPGYVVLAEQDAFVDNGALTAAFRANRSAGAPWALAVEYGVPHHWLSPEQRILTVDWMKDVLILRLGADPSDPGMNAIVQADGWLGDPTLAVKPYASYPGDPLTANWLPSARGALAWASFVRAAYPPTWKSAITPAEVTIGIGESVFLTATLTDQDGEEFFDYLWWEPSSDTEWGVQIVHMDYMNELQNQVRITAITEATISFVARPAGVFDGTRPDGVALPTVITIVR